MDLIFPGYQAILDIDIPAAGPRTIHAMRRVHTFIKRPAITIHIFPVATTFIQLLMPIVRMCFGNKILELLENIAHVDIPPKKSFIILIIILSESVCLSCDKHHSELIKKLLIVRIVHFKLSITSKIRLTVIIEVDNPPQSC